MPTLRIAGDILAAANTPHGRHALASELGFTAELQPVDEETRSRLGLPVGLRCVNIIRGRGALRVLLFESSDAVSLRSAFLELARALSAHTSHVLWVLIGSGGNGSHSGIACWSSGNRGPRVLALVADTKHIVSSDAEVILALSVVSDGDDLLVHTRWCELLGREALSRRFYRELEKRVKALADSLAISSMSDRHELALLYVSRILFLSFLEAKGWLGNDRAFLIRQFDACMTSGARFHQRVLLPLFFGALNTTIAKRSAAAKTFGPIPFLNGGLFSKSALERRYASVRFSDAAFGSLFGDLIGAFRFTAREGQDQWSEAAVDPEMLGRSFESLMASQSRRTTGAFYTPHEMVALLTDRALAVALTDQEISVDQVNAALAGNPLEPEIATALRARLRNFTVIDPACGSGAFLVHVLERVSDLHRIAGDVRPISAIRRDVLARTIHGVDVNPTAVWLCELRLWLSVVIESDEKRMSAVPPLPNLDSSVRTGDTLSGDAFTTAPSLLGPSTASVRLRSRYIRASGPRKAPLRRALAREERQRAVNAIDRELTSLATRRREALLYARSENFFGERSKPTTAMRADMRTIRLQAAQLRRERRRIADGGGGGGGGIAVLISLALW